MEDKNIKFAILATDAVVFGLQSHKLMVLLVRSSNVELKNKWATPGGLVQPRERLEDAVKRQLGGLIFKEDERIYIEQMKTFGDPKRDPGGRVVSVGHVALLPFEDVQIRSNEKFNAVTWFPVDDLPDMAYDGKKMVIEGLKYLRMRLESSDLIRFLVSSEFTLTELQETYEGVTKKSMDKRNFRKKIESLGWLEQVGKKKQVGASRPAELYRFER